MLIDEFTNKDGHDPEQAVEYISHILKSSLPGVLTSASQKINRRRKGRLIITKRLIFA